MAAQRDPAVVTTVSEMLSAIERGGMDAVLRDAAALDHPDGVAAQMTAEEIERRALTPLPTSADRAEGINRRRRRG